MSQTTRLLEYVSQKGTLKVDAERGVIEGVRVLGLVSANGRSYDRAGVGKAAGLYEGKQVNVDHPDRPGQAVSVSRRVGWLENVRQDPDGGLRADLHLLLSHPLTKTVLEAAERRPSLMGLSHNASGKTTRREGKEVVESIEAVHSVDLVADPASVKGLSEGKQMAIYTVREQIERLKATRPGAARALREQAESGITSMDAPAPEMADEAPGTEAEDHEETFISGVISAITAVLKDDSLSWEEKMDHVSKYMRTAKKHANGGSAADTSDSEPEPPMSTEEGLKLQLSAYKQLGQKGVKLTPLVEMAIKGCSTEAEITTLVESLPQQGVTVHSGARSANPREGTAVKQKLQEGKVPEDRKERAQWLTK